MSDAALSLPRRSPGGAFVAFRPRSTAFGDTPVTGGRANDVLRGLRALEDSMEVTPEVAPTARTTAKAKRAALPLWRKIISGLFNVGIIGLAFYLWPARFGGDTSAVLVRGTSMLPRYQLNDVVLVREKDDYDIGDIVLFEIPEGNAKGMTIIHRIIDTWPDGTWHTQGDNRETSDQFHLTDEDLVGTPILHIPKAGRILQLIRNTFVIAGAVGVGAVFLLWPTSRDEEEESDEDDDTGVPSSRRATQEPVIAVVTTAGTTDAGPTIAEIRAAAWQAAHEPITLIDDDEFEALLAEFEIPDDISAVTDHDADAQAWLAAELASLGIDL